MSEVTRLCPPIDPEFAGPLAVIVAELPVCLTAALVADRSAQASVGRLAEKEIERDGTFAEEERISPVRSAHPMSGS